MNFLLINHEYPPVGGGAATATFEIARSLSALGHSVTVLTGCYRHLAGTSQDDSVVVHRVWSVRRHSDRSNIFEMFTFMIGGLFQLPSILARCKPEAAIVFFSIPSGPIGLASNVFAGLPYVVSLRGGDVPGLVPQLGRLHNLIAPLRRNILRRALAVVANSAGLRDLSQRTDPFPIRVIPNGVDTDFFRPNSKKPSDRLRILFVGRFQEQKNLAFLLEQVAKLPSGTFELHLVGDGPLREDLRNLARDLGIAAHVVWHGWLTRAALVTVYQDVDCLVNPSLYEGLPNTVLEAMACGLPVIASTIPGNEELVLDGETGFLFNLADPHGLTTALLRLRDANLRLRLGTRGRARCISEFSWTTVAVEYLRSFET